MEGCENCTFPHQPKNYEKIIRLFKKEKKK
jgi:Zn-finger protein